VLRKFTSVLKKKKKKNHNYVKTRLPSKFQWTSQIYVEAV